MITAHATFIVLAERGAATRLRPVATRRPGASPALRRVIGWFATVPATARRAWPGTQRMIV